MMRSEDLTKARRRVGKVHSRKSKRATLLQNGADKFSLVVDTKKAPKWWAIKP
jgi:hypothetical protein